MQNSPLNSSELAKQLQALTPTIDGACQHLAEALTESEEAVSNIFQKLSNIQQIITANNTTPEMQAKIDSEINQIFEICTFQDVSGQRIKNTRGLLQQLSALTKPSDTSKAEQPKATPIGEDSLSLEELKNGPQLKQKALNQSDIDNMF